MSLPVITSLADCADFSKTVAPHFRDFYTSLTTGRITISDVTNLESLKSLYLTTNPVVSAFFFVVAACPLLLIISEANKNYSQVDRIWSILPTVFNAHFAYWTRLHGLPTKRVDSVLAFSALWSMRLTFNYWRKGGYQIGSEDYRWELIKKYIGQPAFFLLNIVFISSLQVLILLAITTPTYIILLTSRIHPDLTPNDTKISWALIALITIEYFADGQQWAYQQAKKSYRATAKVPEGWTRAQMDRGFVTTGLWRWSRHPNFAAEQTIWVVLYAWGCVESGVFVNWTAVGAATYLLVFAGSTPLTEWITRGKYAEYELYQEKVGRFLPFPFSGGWNEEAAIEAEKKRVEKDKAK